MNKFQLFITDVDDAFLVYCGEYENMNDADRILSQEDPNIGYMVVYGKVIKHVYMHHED